MKKAFKYRLYPTVAQVQSLDWTLARCLPLREPDRQVDATAALALGIQSCELYNAGATSTSLLDTI